MPRTTTIMPAGATTSTLDMVGDADITSKMTSAGASFGELLLRSGQAVAATQSRLNDSGATTAVALARTLVDVIAVEERVYDEDGTLDSVETHTRKLPLVTFIDPVFYEWRRVRLQGVFRAMESVSSRERDTRSYSFGAGFGGGSGLLALGGPLVVGGGLLGGGFGQSMGSGSSDTDTATDVSRGLMRMNALLRPRRNTAIPKPNQAVRGPRLSILQGEIADVMSGTTLTGRTMSLLVQYTKRDGSPIEGKQISVETEGVPWTAIDAAGGPTEPVTSEEGGFEILLRREFPDGDADTAPATFTVTARIGLVSNTTAVTF